MIKRVKKLRPVPTNCPFCKGSETPNYKDTEVLGRYLTERGKVIGKARTGVCSKHMRGISRSIKQARYIGLMPFVISPR